jgi:hypothetical protein
MKLAQKAEPLGVVVVAQCDLQMDGCTARQPAPVTIVKVGPAQDQFVVCRSCLEKMIQEGEWSVSGSRVRALADFWLKDPTDRAILAVEVKSLPRTTALDLERWASSLRRNLIAHSALPSTPYFLLLVVPATGFLWSNSNSSLDAAPDYSFNLTELAPPGDAAPEESGRSAEEWAERSLKALIERKLNPDGLWWTESGLKRAVENDRLKLVRQDSSR